MLKSIVKLALAVLIANAAWRIGSVYVSHLRFREGVRLAAAAAGPNDEPLRHAITSEAQRHDVPTSGADVTIQRAERRLDVTGSYSRTIEVVPGYDYPWTFNWEVEVFLAPSMNQVTSPR